MKASRVFIIPVVFAAVGSSYGVLQDETAEVPYTELPPVDEFGNIVEGFATVKNPYLVTHEPLLSSAEDESMLYEEHDSFYGPPKSLITPEAAVVNAEEDITTDEPTPTVQQPRHGQEHYYGLKPEYTESWINSKLVRDQYEPPNMEMYADITDGGGDDNTPFVEMETTVSASAFQRLSSLNDESHCFLHAAPYSQCGRRSLQYMMLEQCLSFFSRMTQNIAGLCLGDDDLSSTSNEHPVFGDTLLQRNHVAARTASSGYGSQEHTTPVLETTTAAPAAVESDEQQPPTEEPTTEPSPTLPFEDGTTGTRSRNYIQERCYQRAYLSITTAVVMCLTENIVRTAFIEHYASQAAENPVEGPILYMRKMHEFIEKVLDCVPEQSKNNFPNLWHTFKQSESTTYNPNSPFMIRKEGRVRLEPHMSYEAAGLKGITVGSSFLCSDTSLLNSEGYYSSTSSNEHYALKTIQQCSTDSKTALGYVPLFVNSSTIQMSKVLKQCNRFVSHADGTHDFLTDMTLRGIYDSVSYTEHSYENSHRPLTIAEIAVSNSGTFSQPILEGFGIAYYCAFFACKANNENNVDGTCFPEVDTETEWDIPEHVVSSDVLYNLAQTVELCKVDGFLGTQDIQLDAATHEYELGLKRSHICMAEQESVRFFKLFYPNLKVQDDAHTLVYLRHLATEKCHDVSSGACMSNEALYGLLSNSLHSLSELCKVRKVAHDRRKAAAEAAERRTRRYKRYSNEDNARAHFFDAADAYYYD